MAIKNIKKKLVTFLYLYLFIPLTTSAQVGPADGDPATGNPTIKNPLRNTGETAGGIDSIPELIDFIVSLLVGFVGFMATIAILFSGYQMVFSGGDPEKRKAAQSRMLWAIMGIVVVVLAYSIVRIILLTLTGG